jgi:ORF6N domain
VANTQRTAPVPVEHITQSILVFRGHKVLLDTDLADLAELAAAEWSALRSRIVTLKPGRGQHRKYPPYAFTEQGVAMLSSVLNSDRAIAVNIEIMRAFVKLRELLVSNKELARRFAQLETRLDKKLTEHDRAIGAILSAIHDLMRPPPPEQRPIGFTANLDEKPRRQD